MEVPEPIILHRETPSPFTPLGAKGVGEGNCMSTPVCIANAVADALGLADVTLPLLPARLARHMHGEESKQVSRRQSAPARGSRRLFGEGRTEVAASREQVWAALLDPDVLAAIVPGAHDGRQGVSDYAFPRRCHARCRPGEGPLPGGALAVRSRPAARGHADRIGRRRAGFRSRHRHRHAWRRPRRIAP